MHTDEPNNKKQADKSKTMTKVAATKNNRTTLCHHVKTPKSPLLWQVTIKDK